MQNRYPSARFQYLKHKVQIVDVLLHLTGRSVGGNQMICCPLHNDRTPSMKINIEWNGCKCFGACGKWFDPISLYAEFQGIKPHQALVDLEKLFNVKWDGSCEELLETADQLSPWSRLEAELIRQCEVASLEEPQRIRMRSSYWLAQNENQDVNKISKLIGLSRAREIIHQWKADNDR